MVVMVNYSVVLPLQKGSMVSGREEEVICSCYVLGHYDHSLIVLRGTGHNHSLIRLYGRPMSLDTTIA